MSRINVVTEFIGSTLRTTAICSGATMSPISSALYNGAEQLISSVSMTSSGNGFYYGNLTLPMSRQWMMNEIIGVINTNTYRRYQLVDVQKPEVD